jgi:DNA-binding PadR family transcriptional regulator
LSLEYAILGFLQSADLSGYDLKTRCFDHEAAHFWTADQAQVYRTLDRLEHRGDVTSTSKRQRNKPDRRVYSLTDEGRTRLRDWAREDHPLPPYRDPFLVQLRFSDELETESIHNALAHRRAAHQERLDTLRARAAEFGADGRTRTQRGAALQRMTLDAAIANERAAIDWLDQCIESTETADLSGPSTSSSRRGGGGRR